MTQDRDQFIAANAKREPHAFTPEAIDDLKFFAKRADEGRALSMDGLIKWFSEKHGIVAKRTRLKNVALAHGIQPWWSA